MVTAATMMMNQAVMLVAQTLEVEYCHILELQPGGKFLLLRAGVGWKDGCVGRAVIPADPQTESGFTLTAGEAVVFERLAEEIGVILPIGMAVAWLRNKFDEDVLGRKQNISDLGNIHDAKSGLLTALDNASRVGTFGFLGEGVNYFLNDDNVRPITLDNRIFFANRLSERFRNLVW